MVIIIFLEKEKTIEYFNWLYKYLLECRGSSIRLIDESSHKVNETDLDKENFRYIFPFFSYLLSCSRECGYKRNLFEDEIEKEYAGSYMCFDCSVVVSHGDVTIALIVLELGGASDMVIKILDNFEGGNIINLDTKKVLN